MLHNVSRAGIATIRSCLQTYAKCFLKFLTDQSAEDNFTAALKTAVESLRISKHRRKEYMTLQEKLYDERKEGRAEGRAEEKQNTERERRRAEAAEEKVRQLEAQLASLKTTD